MEDDLELERMTTELEQLSTDLDHDKRIHFAATEEDLNWKEKCSEVFVENELFMEEQMRQNALTRQVEDVGGSLISYYKRSDGWEESHASRFVDRFQYLEEQAKVAYPQYNFHFEDYH